MTISWMKGGLLYILVFVAGMTTMATEMSASRLLAPYFGNSLLIWANLIGLILIYLTVGYFLGGKIADRHPQARLLYGMTLTAAATIAILPFVAKPIMALAIRGLEQVSAGAFLGSFAVTVLLFALPVTILGTVTPFAIRLKMQRVEQAGNISGGLYALSTVGSILGTFLPVLLLIPSQGTRNTMLLFAGALAAVSAIGLGSAWYRGAPLVILAGLFVPQGAIKPASDSIFEAESPYHYIQVAQQGGTRYLRLNEGWAVHSAYNPDRVLSGSYWDYFLVAPFFAADEPPREVLNIGSAAGTIAKEILTFYPQAHVDGIEIDPEVVEVGRRFFEMNEDRFSVQVADGRPFLRSSDKSYDFIAVDAYRQPYIPFYLTTQEFFADVRDHLNEHGVAMVNVGKVPGDDGVVDAIGATLRSVFPTVYSFSAGSFNQMLIATKSPSQASDLSARLTLMPPPVASLAQRAAAGLSHVEPGGLVLTDDRAPVEWLTDQMIIHYATRE